MLISSPIIIMDQSSVPRYYTPTYVVIAYFVSYIGAWTTLELLCRRTASRGYYNWFILAGSSVAMGGIAIWGMYFIGNRAIVIGDGSDEMQLSYNSGFTALSFFIPIFILLIAFSVVGATDEKLNITRVILGGLLAGLGVCGMHYVGQAGISNYECVYTVAHVIAATAIAIVASVIALGVFSFYRSSFDMQWWCRALCAAILAAAVSGMHWVASVGTEYHLKEGKHDRTNNFSRKNTSIGVIVLSVSGCVFLFLFTLLGQRRIALYKSKAQQVALAAAIFDEEGRIMVTPEGLLPHRKITNTYLEQSINDVFCISHPLFIWIFRTTHNWKSVVDLIPAMRAHIYRTGVKNRLGSHDGNMVTDQGTPIEDYAIVFRDLFCTAAADLADDFSLPLEKMGILYDDIVSTGKAPKDESNGKKRLRDIEREALMQDGTGSGQLMFLVKEVDMREEHHLQAAGYRFAPPEKVIDLLASSVQISQKLLIERLGMLRDYVSTDHTLDPGVHLACFTIRASLKPGRGGFEILARKDATNLLPTMQLPFDRIEQWQTQYLKGFDSLSVVALMKLLRKASMQSNPSQQERIFAKQLFTRLEALKEEINDPFFNDATLISKPVEVPCRGQTEDSPPGTATLIVFKIIVPIQSRAPGKKLDFVPVNFFKMQQFVYQNSPDHDAFARKTLLEFAPALGVEDMVPALVKSKTPQVGSIERVAAVEDKEPESERRTFVDDLFAICVATRK